MHEHSHLLKVTMGALYPFIIVFGIYIIINGHKTPGGGFQGGAILAACFIINYLVTFKKNIRLRTLTRLEKLLYLAILVFATMAVLYNNIEFSETMKQIYLISMNVLIAIKVCCGLTVIFFRFILFESR